MKDFHKYFIGKACTITTLQINYRFKEEQMMDYFMGIIDDIDEHGILMTHPVTKCKNYIFFPHIVSISEEQYLSEDNPEYAKIIEEYRKEKPLTAARTVVTAEPKSKPSPFVDIKAMADIAKKVR
jgi:hypothetical protein